MSKPVAPLSPKVPGAVGGGAVGALVCWLLGVFAFGAPIDAANATVAIAAVPWPVLGVVGLGLTALGGYLPRDLASTLFEGQVSEDHASYGNAMGNAGAAPAAGPTVAAIEPLTGDTDDGTADEPDADDEPARDPETGRFVAED